MNLMSDVLCLQTRTGHEPFPERPRGSGRGTTDGRDHHASIGAVQDRLARHNDDAAASRKRFLY